MFSHQHKGHLKANKSKTQQRRAKEPGQLSETHAKKVKKMLNKEG